MKPTHRYFNALPHEISAALRGELRCVVRPLARGLRPAEGPNPYYGIKKNETAWKMGRSKSRLSGTGCPCEFLSKCPLGHSGTLLLGREAFYCDDYQFPNGDMESMKDALFYKSDARRGKIHDLIPEGEPSHEPWLSSHRMPEWAVRPECRFTVESVECKRACELTEEEAIAAGHKPFWDTEKPVRHKMPDGSIMEGHPAEAAKEAMRRLYESKHGPGSWERDWVWCVKVKKEGGGE